MPKIYLLVFLLLLITRPLHAQVDTTIVLGQGQSVHVIYHLAETDKPLVVLQSGARSYAVTWNDLVPLLKEAGYSYLAYDRPGLGESQSIDTDRDGATIAMELREIIKMLSIDKDIILVGHSMGGVYQAVYANSYPEKVRGLIMIDSPDGGWESGLRACLTAEQNNSRDSTLQVLRATAWPVAALQEHKGAEDSFSVLKEAEIAQTLIIISGGSQSWPPGYDADCLNQAWRDVQQRMTELGEDVTQLISEASGHGIPY